MNVLDGIEKRDIRNLLGKGWLTHDGMWFLQVYQKLGIDEANELNKAAIKSMAPIEIGRAKRLLGVGNKRFETIDELMGFMLAALELTLPDSVSDKFHLELRSRDLIHWNWEEGQCFAYKGMKQIGSINGYNCGVMYRIECWLEALGVKYSIQPRIEKCLMHDQGFCQGEFRVFIE